MPIRNAESITRESVQGVYSSLSWVFWFHLIWEPAVVRFRNESAYVTGDQLFELNPQVDIF